jgi:glutamate-1-semialdehyde 2,1-aminomutase
MIAIRAARAATGRDAILRFDGCYHGTYDGALQPGALGVPAAVASDIVSVPLGDHDAFLAALDCHGDRLAAVLFDLMPNRAGLRPAAQAFAELVRAETERRGIVLILDEVITFRMARGGMQSLYGIAPDLVTLGKLVGGGFPVGAVGGRAELMQVFDPRGERPVSHGGTFSANPVTLRAGIAALDALDADAIAHINRLGDRLRGRLADAGYVVAGSGSLLRIITDEPELLWWRLYREGVLIAGNGLACVSTPMDDEVIDATAAAFERARA